MIDQLQQQQHGATTTTRPQMRAALLYWMSQPVRDLAQRQPSALNNHKPLQIATGIVNELHRRFRDAPSEKARREAAQDLEFALIGTNVEESCNNTLTRLIAATLKPLQSSFSWLKQTGSRQVFIAKENVHHLCTASHLFELLQSLHADNIYFANLQPDQRSLQTHLNLLGKRTKFLVFCLGPKPFPGRPTPLIRRGVQWSAESTSVAMGGQMTVQELIESANRAIAHAKFPLDPIHYGMLGSLYADASYNENGMADAAAERLNKQHRRSPSMYNPVLLAYTREMDRHQAAGRHAAALHSQTQCEAVFAHIQQPDAVSYSILLKLYKYQPATAQKVLDQLRAPKLIHFNAVLDAWAKAGQSEPAKALLRRMEALNTVDRVSYTTVLTTAATTEEVKELLDRCVRMEDPACRPDPVMYTTVFSSYFSKLKAAPQRKQKHAVAQDMRDLLEHLLECSHFQSVVISAGVVYKYYNTVFRAWGYVGTPASVEQSLDLLETMQARGQTPNAQTYQNLLSSVAYGGDIATAATLFASMEEQDIPRTTPAVVGYLRQLLAQSKSDDEFGGRILERLLVAKADSFKVGPVFEGLFGELVKVQDTQKKLALAKRIEKLWRYLNKHGGEETKVPYNECFRAWAFSLSAEASDRALRLLEEMKLSDETPDNKTYEYILTCLSRNPTNKAVATARSIFSEIGATKLPITLSTLNCFVRVLVRSGTTGALQEAEALVDSIEKGKEMTGIVPNMNTYDMVWRGFMRSGNLRKADDLLAKMEQHARRHRSELSPTPQMRLEMMSLWAESPADDAMERVESHFNVIARGGKPTSAMYASLQTAWCKSKRSEAPGRVEAILVRMQSDFERGFNPLCQPKLENFNAVISCLADQGDAERAEAVLNRMVDLAKTSKYADLAPTTKTYESAIRGWALSSSPNAGKRSLLLLGAAKQSWHAKKQSPPNLKCYNYALEAMSRSRDENKAQQCYFLLREMISSSQSGKNRFVLPTQATFVHVMKSCASSSDNDAALNVVMGAMEDYLKLHSRQVSGEVFVQFLHALFRLVPFGKSRDEAILHVLLDEKCPASVISTRAVRDSLAKSLSQDGHATLLQQKHRL